LYRSGSTSNDRRDSRKGGNRLALAGKKDVGEEEEEEEEEEKGEKEEEKERGEREKGEDARRKILLKRGKHTRLGFLCLFLLLILLLCSCSCRALVGFLHRCCV
jgi:hypothetical protein